MTDTQNHTIAGTGYGSPYVDSLVWGHAGWTVGTPITYFLADSLTGGDAIEDSTVAAAGYDGVVDGWSVAETASFVQILDNYAAVCGLTFAAAADVQSANLVEWQVSSSFWGGGILGQHDIPDGDNGHNGNANQVWGYYNFQATSSWGQIQQGGDGFQTLIHELGHGMGLAHPHDGGGQSDGTLFPGVSSSGDTGDYGLNQCPYTVMSYNYYYDGVAQPSSLAYGETGTLGAFDIAALQAMYGANMATATGSNTYTLPTANASGTFWTCIWDAGGIDTISNSGSSLASVIDLREAPLIGEHAGGYISANAGVAGGLTIANGVVIEKATGGSGNDFIVGNQIGNTLRGNSGLDTLIGSAGSDSLLGGASNDRLYGDASTGGDTGVGLGSGVYNEPGTDPGNHSTATAIDVSNLFSLASNANIANSTTQPHVTINGVGNSNVDFFAIHVTSGTTFTFDIDGTSGTDTYIRLYNPSGTEIAHNDDAAGDPGSSSSLDSSLTYNVTADGTYFISVGDLNGPMSSGATYQLHISVAGQPAVGEGNGNDTLDGGSGADTMAGGAGNDVYYVDSLSDIVVEANGGGIDTVYSLASFSLYGQYIERLTLTGTSNVNATGNGIGNKLIGNDGNNKLDGKGGADTMDGGDGNDTYYVDNAGDQVIEASGKGVDKVYSTVTFSLSGQFADNLTLQGLDDINGTGNSLANILVGNAGKNELNGSTGADTLTGGTGQDRFVFANTIQASNVDHVTDMKHGIDKIVLDKSFFSELNLNGQSSTVFKDIASGSVDSTDRILYNHNTGELFYDSDGSGSATAKLFAILDNHPTDLAASDFTVIA